MKAKRNSKKLYQIEMQHLKGVRNIKTFFYNYSEFKITEINPFKTYVTYKGVDYKVVSMVDGYWQDNVSYATEYLHENNRYTPVVAVFDKEIFFLDEQSIRSIFNKNLYLYKSEGSKPDDNYFLLLRSGIEIYNVRRFVY